MRRRTMNRRDAHLDAVLRHLGAAYYDSLHGKAAPADVARAVDSVAGQVGEEPTGQPAVAGPEVGGVPVLTMGRHVAGVVSEGDLLAARDANPAAGRRRRVWPRRRPA